MSRIAKETKEEIEDLQQLGISNNEDSNQADEPTVDEITNKIHGIAEKYSISSIDLIGLFSVARQYYEIIDKEGWIKPSTGNISVIANYDAKMSYITKEANINPIQFHNDMKVLITRINQ